MRWLACRARLSSCHARLERARARRAGSWYPWYVVGVLTLFSVSGNIDQQILSLLIRPIERDFHITDSQFGYLGGIAFALFFAVLGLPIARLADRTSRRNVMVGGATLWSVFTSLCAGAKTFGQLFVLRMGVGVGEATLNAPAASLLADYFPREKFAGAMSVLSAGIFIGSGAGYAIGGYIVGATANGLPARSSASRRHPIVAARLSRRGPSRAPRRVAVAHRPRASPPARGAGAGAVIRRVDGARRETPAHVRHAGARVRDVVERELLSGGLDSGRLSSPIRLERVAGRAAPGAAHDFHRTSGRPPRRLDRESSQPAPGRPTRRFASA